MTKKKLLIIVYFICIVFVLLIVFVIRAVTSHPINRIPSESPTPPLIPISTQALESPTDPLFGVSVVSTSPTNNQSNVPLNEQFTINLNKEVARENVHYSISPDTTSTFAINGTTLTIQPNQLQPGTFYAFSLQLGRLSNGNYNVFSFAFTTTGTAVSSIPPVNETLAPGAADNYQLQHDPDIYLSNRTPYSSNTFSISSSYNLSMHQFAFVVQSIGSNSTQSKNDFISWAESLGLTADQINGLDIIYQ